MPLLGLATFTSIGSCNGEPPGSGSGSIVFYSATTAYGAQLQALTPPAVTPARYLASASAAQPPFGLGTVDRHGVCPRAPNHHVTVQLDTYVASIIPVP